MNKAVGARGVWLKRSRYTDAMDMHTNFLSIGAITRRRALRADGTEREHLYKTFRVAGRHGGATTVAAPVDEVYAWMRTYDLSLPDIARLLRDAARLLRRSPPTSSGLYLSWAALVRARALKLAKALSADVAPEDLAWAEKNNAAWDAATGDNE